MSTFEQLKSACLAVLATGFMWAEWSLARGALTRAGGPVPWAVAFDLVCVFPGAYWLLVLRPASRPLLELAPVVPIAAESCDSSHRSESRRAALLGRQL